MNPSHDGRGPAAPIPAAVNRMPNRRGLAALEQMFGYFDQDAQIKAVDLSYDHIAA